MKNTKKGPGLHARLAGVSLAMAAAVAGVFIAPTAAHAANEVYPCPSGSNRLDYVVLTFQSGDQRCYANRGSFEPVYGPVSAIWSGNNVVRWPWGALPKYSGKSIGNQYLPWVYIE